MYTLYRFHVPGSSPEEYLCSEGGRSRSAIIMNAKDPNFLIRPLNGNETPVVKMLSFVWFNFVVVWRLVQDGPRLSPSVLCGLGSAGCTSMLRRLEDKST